MHVKNKIGWVTAAGLVIANMIGTGVFTSLGFQLESIRSTWSITILWVIGGMLALIGAFIYAELGTHFKKSGGDYIFLSSMVHPVVGYLYAWTALIVGFSAPIALAAMAMAYYLAPFLPMHYGNIVAIGTILIVSLFHSFNIKQSGIIHMILTVIKIAFAVALIVLGMVIEPTVINSAVDTTSPWINELFLPGFAVSLIYVSYAYTGWNSAAYIVGEIEAPHENLPKSLIAGTILVTILYVLLQIVFLKHGTHQQLSGHVDVAIISFGNLFNGELIHWISLFISIQLIGTISGYIWIGPRITAAMAKEYKLWTFFSSHNEDNIPVRALWLTTVISILLIFTGSFEQVLLYAGIVLQLMGTVTVAASLTKKTTSESFKAPGRPWLPLLYLVFSCWIVLYTVYERPMDSLIGFAIIGAGVLIYIFDRPTIASAKH